MEHEFAPKQRKPIGYRAVRDQVISWATRKLDPVVTVMLKRAGVKLLLDYGD